ncbi:MAG: PQQ-binding-like beta-propeller repeat protein, partial [Anaerolineae bacterium]
GIRIMGRLTTRQLASKRGRRHKPNKKSSLQPGDMLQNRYRVVGTLGVGGFSSVYQARDMRFQNVTKLCAIKEMVLSAPDPKIRELTIKSFERESSMLAMLDHPSMPDVSDYFTQGDRSYLVMELIRGKDLEVWLEEQEEPLEQETAISWLIQVLEALIHLHNQKPTPIVFRDLKPSNLMLDQYGRIRIIDFGIAKLFEGPQKGTMIGTEGYSPPEQYRGQASPVGDLYALSATFHHLLTKQDPRLEPPFTFSERPIQKVNSTVTVAFEAIIMRCLAYDPGDRFASAAAFKQALELISRPTVVEAIPPEQAPADGTVSSPLAGAATVGATKIQPIWEFKCEDEIRSKVALVGDRALVGAYDNNLYAVNKTNGEFIWKFPAEEGFGSSPCVHDETVLIGSVDKRLYNISLKNGRMKWNFSTKGAIYSSPSVRFDHVFFGSDDGFFYALNASHGKEVWRMNAYSPIRSSPFVGEDYIYFGTDGGYLYCVELANGKNKWQAQAKRAIISSPTVYDDIVFVGSMDSTFYAMDAGSGWVIWRFRTRRPIISSPVVNKNSVYIGSSDGNLYALDINNGRQLWLFETEGQITSSPVIWEDAVYFGATDGNVYCISKKKGELRWKFQTDGPVISPPLVDEGVVYVGSTDNKLYALPA